EPAFCRTGNHGNESLRPPHGVAELDISAAECDRTGWRLEALRQRRESRFRSGESVINLPLPASGESDCLDGQAFCHGVLSLRMALRMVRSFRATAMRATFFG